MGLYDGVDTLYSTYELAKVTKTPVILIINCSNIGSTVGAIVKGLKYYRNDVNIRGVIFNKIASETHYNYCKTAVEDVEVLGYVPFDKNLEVKSRHLGLVTIEDNKEVQDLIRYASELVEKYVDLDKIYEMASDEDLEVDLPKDDENKGLKRKMAIAYDPAFSFYYQENLDILRSRYELEFFSPLNDEHVEECRSYIYRRRLSRTSSK